MLPTNTWAVILAGGSGTRFWPRSRHLRPKQLCSIGPIDKTLIEETLDRLDGLVPPERRLIVTHHEQMERTKELTSGSCAHYLAEPAAKNTAHALALAALEIKALSGSEDTVMVSFHADHLISNMERFESDIGLAVKVAERGHLTLIGAHPAYPETGYGYIEQGEPIEGLNGGFRVKRFREKPDADTAKFFIESGGFHWNTGLFTWPVGLILKELNEHLPKSMDVLQTLVGSNQSFQKVSAKDFAAAYERLPKVAIDNAVLERSENVAVIAAGFDWQDVGTWAGLRQCFPTNESGNIELGDFHTIDSKRVTVDANDGVFVATIGVEDLVVVAMKDAVLVCSQDRAQDVKMVVEHLKASNRSELI